MVSCENNSYLDEHKAKYANTIYAINNAFSRKSENDIRNPYFFCSNDYIFDNNQIQCSFCEHGNYYPDLLDFRYIKNDYYTTKIYCNTCDISDFTYSSE
jgi:hypothetical protein